MCKTSYGIIPQRTEEVYVISWVVVHFSNKATTVLYLPNQKETQKLSIKASLL